MTDKTRLEFEEYWGQRNTLEAFRREAEAAWKAAKERYEPRWISCEDRLPKDGDYSVMAFWNHGGMDMIHVQDYFQDITAGIDDDGNQLYVKRYLSHGVTHWMPLPDEPSTQGEQQ